MTVGTPTNNRIIANLLVALYTALTNQCYAVFVTVQRLWIPERRMATYPDIMVMSEPLTYQERRTDTFNYDGSSVCVMQWTGVIRDGTLI
jgi:Uma2 family endonuclease